jgi:hypothetical protein
MGNIIKVKTSRKRLKDSNYQKETIERISVNKKINRSSAYAVLYNIIKNMKAFGE